MSYTVTVKSLVDGTILASHYFQSHADARAEKARLEEKHGDDLCVVEIEEVGHGLP